MDHDARSHTEDTADHVEPTSPTPGRSRNMAAIRRTNTKPEVALRSALHRAGYRFRKDLRLQIGSTWVRPDIVFTRQHIAVFIDGCFWHSCPEHGRAPAVNGGYWGPKFDRTRQRDERDSAALREAGWSVLRIWEHVSTAEAVSGIGAALDGRA